MRTYYKHTKTETADVPFTFRCEQCMQESGLKIATITGMKAEIDSNFKNLDAGCYFFSGVVNNLTIALAVGSLLLNIVKIAVKKKQTANVLQKNVPVIDWSAVQHILNEAL